MESYGQSKAKSYLSWVNLSLIFRLKTEGYGIVVKFLALAREELNVFSGQRFFSSFKHPYTKARKVLVIV